jgi:hypothetical protein
MTAAHLSLQALAAPLPFQAYRLPVRFPIAGKDLPPVKWFWEALVAALAREQGLSSQVFLQLTQYKGGSQRFAQHGSSWMPVLGLGVWPDRPPPAPWTRDEFKKIAPNELLRPLADQVLHVTQNTESARNTMLDIGSVLEILIAGDGKKLIERSRQVLLAGIDQPAFRVYGMYIALLEGKTVASADAAQLTEWLCGALVYIRESFEDQGILIVSRVPLEGALRALGGRLESEREWRIPSGAPAA